MLSLGLTPQAEAAAIVSFINNDDGTFMVTGSGDLDPGGFPFFVSYSTATISFTPFAGQGFILDANDFIITGGGPASFVDVFGGFVPIASTPGWTNPVYGGFFEFGLDPGIPEETGFFWSPNDGAVGYLGTGFSYTFPGQLEVLGLTAGESTFLQSTFTGDTMTLVTIAAPMPPGRPMTTIPEPSGVMSLGALLGLGLMFRSRR